MGKRFQHRQTPNELVQKNILKGTFGIYKVDNSKGVSSTIVQHKIELEEERKKDTLSKRLNARPTKTDLVEKNIMKGLAY